MNKVWIPALSAACLSLGALSAEARMLSHFNGNGAFADLDAYDGNGKSYLYVSESRSNGITTDYLAYYTSSCDPTTGTCQGISGYGSIPSRDFGATTNTASLATNTSTNPNFSATKWSYNKSTGVFTESPVDLGVININWKSSGDYSSKGTGTSTNTYLNTTYKSTGQYSSADAIATGTITGVPVEPVYSSIGINSNNDITIERK